MGLHHLFALFALSSAVCRTNAAVTVYTTTSALPPEVSAHFADQTILTPPGAPGGLNAIVNVQLDPTGMPGLSLPVVRDPFSFYLFILNSLSFCDCRGETFWGSPSSCPSQPVSVRSA